MSDFAQYKAQAMTDLTRDTNLDKAADLTAQRRVLLEDASIPDGLKQVRLKQLNRQVRTWTTKVREPFRGYESNVPQVGEDHAADPTKAMVHALLKTLKTEPEEPTLDVKTPANVILPKPRLVLTPKPTPTPRRPKPKKPATPLSGITALPNTRGTSQEFDRILTRSEQDFDRIQKRYERLKKKQQTEDPESTPRQPKKNTLGKAVKRGLKKGLKDGVKQWLDFWRHSLRAGFY